jgi:hypothetical protein
LLVVALLAGRRPTEPSVTAEPGAGTTQTTMRWGEPLGGTTRPETATSAARPATGPDRGSAVTTLPAGAGAGSAAEPDPPAEPVEEGSEGDPGPGPLNPGDYAISSNATEDYPLEAMVDPAVRLLRAELTGEGAEAFPHLAGRLEGPCCRDLVVNGVVVLFGETTDDPARIMVDWEATELQGGANRRAVTETRWWWVDGTWLGQFEREQVGVAE